MFLEGGRLVMYSSLKDLIVFFSLQTFEKLLIANRGEIACRVSM